MANPDKPLDWIRFAHWTRVPYEVRAAWPDIREALTLDDMSAAVGTVRAGIGATRMPCFLGDPDPELTRLPGLATFDYPGIWVLTHRDLRSVKKDRKPSCASWPAACADCGLCSPERRAAETDRLSHRPAIFIPLTPAA